MKNQEQMPTAKTGWLAAGLFAAVLAVLFWRSFMPGFVHFSNDGPLGQQNFCVLHFPGAFTGMWDDLNDIGSSGGMFALGVTGILKCLLGPVGEGKFYVPIALFILSLGAWTFFRQSQFSPLAAVLGGLAAALNGTFFAAACWGVATQEIAIGMDFFALALVVSNTPETPILRRLARLALAGLGVGIRGNGGADHRRDFKLVLAAFVFYKALDEGGSVSKKSARGYRAWPRWRGLPASSPCKPSWRSLVRSPRALPALHKMRNQGRNQWDFATQWSLPKKETLGFLVPGLFGYRMDTPGHGQSLQDFYQGGDYWGGGAFRPLDQYFDSGNQGKEPPGIMRFNGDGNYFGILVVLLAAFAIAQSLAAEFYLHCDAKKIIWFWTAIMVVGLVAGVGKVRAVLSIILLCALTNCLISPPSVTRKIHFRFFVGGRNFSGYGSPCLEPALLELRPGSPARVPAQLKNSSFEPLDLNGCRLAPSRSAPAGMAVYSSGKIKVSFVICKMVEFPRPNTAKEIAALASAGRLVRFNFRRWPPDFCVLVIAGIFSGKRAKLGGVLLGALLVLDLGRADLPFIIHWDYVQKYASNPILTFEDKPYEHRVAIVPFLLAGNFPFHGATSLIASNGCSIIFRITTFSPLTLCRCRAWRRIGGF